MVMDDFPEPDTPVTTTRRFLGMFRLTFRRLLARAPLIKMVSLNRSPLGFSSTTSSFFGMDIFFLDEKAPAVKEGLSRLLFARAVQAWPACIVLEQDSEGRVLGKHKKTGQSGISAASADGDMGITGVRRMHCPKGASGGYELPERGAAAGGAALPPFLAFTVVRYLFPRPFCGY